MNWYSPTAVLDCPDGCVCTVSHTLRTTHTCLLTCEWVCEINDSLAVRNLETSDNSGRFLRWQKAEIFSNCPGLYSSTKEPGSGPVLKSLCSEASAQLEGYLRRSNLKNFKIQPAGQTWTRQGHSGRKQGRGLPDL